MQFKALTLASLAVAPAPVFGIGCYSLWKQGTDYFSGYIISAVVPLNATAGTTQTKNFKCISGSQSSLSHCPSYDPSNSQQASAAWSDQGVCSGPLVAPPPTPQPTGASWYGKGCPEEWVDGASYEGGELAEVNGFVYKCSTAPSVNTWCGHWNYKPGDSQYWALLLVNAGGCPNEYDPSATYEEGDKVMLDDVTYKCRSWPNSAWCSVDVYAPGGVYSDIAWTTVGYCDGTISPTTAPAFSSLKDHNGCPDSYDKSRKYEANDKVASEVANAQSLVWQCSEDVHRSQYCSQFEPGHEYKLAWNLIGYCDGTMSPTSSPNFSNLKEVGDGCPMAYDAATDYEEGDALSTRAKAWPYKAFCDAGPDYAPGSDNSNLGWTLQGYCDGTISPTPAPIFTECKWYNGTNAITVNSWSKANAWSYVPGTRVHKDGKIYTCREWPYGLWCKKIAYEPERIFVWPGDRRMCANKPNSLAFTCASNYDFANNEPNCFTFYLAHCLTRQLSLHWPNCFARTKIWCDTVVVGSVIDDGWTGSAYVYQYSDANSTWVEVAKLTAADRASYDMFGWSVSVSGNTTVIGSHADDDKGSDSGSAYVFQNSDANGWVQVQKLTASDGAASDTFGNSVSISGNTIVIGSHQDDDTGGQSGSAYVYQYNDANSTWVQVQKLTASDAAGGDFFGCHVEVSGNTTVIGSYMDDDMGTDSGSAYVFQNSDANGWVQVQKLTASDGAAYDHFGRSVSVSGNTIVVGSYGDDQGNDIGSAYIFQYSAGNGWVEVAKLTPSAGAAGDKFGFAVSVSGNTAIVGSRQDDDKGSNSGAAYVFQYSAGNGWAQVAKLIPSDGVANDNFGRSVSVSGNTAIVGVGEDMGPPVTSLGYAYVYGL
ncbi:hypothetical protein ACHAXN_008493 [Cyclotella atomus]